MPLVVSLKESFDITRDQKVLHLAVSLPKDVLHTNGVLEPDFRGTGSLRVPREFVLRNMVRAITAQIEGDILTALKRVES